MTQPHLPFLLVRPREPSVVIRLDLTSLSEKVRGMKKGIENGSKKISFWKSGWEKKYRRLGINNCIEQTPWSERAATYPATFRGSRKSSNQRCHKTDWRREEDTAQGKRKNLIHTITKLNNTVHWRMFHSRDPLALSCMVWQHVKGTWCIAYVPHTFPGIDRIPAMSYGAMRGKWAPTSRKAYTGRTEIYAGTR